MMGNLYFKQIIKLIGLVYVLVISCFLLGNAQTLNTTYDHDLIHEKNHEDMFVKPNESTFDYVLVDISKIHAPDFVQDSLLRMVEVNVSDMSVWFKKMDTFKKARKVLPSLEKLNRPSWLIIALMLILIGLGLVRIFFYPTFLNIIQSYYNERVLMQISKEDSVLTSWPYILLFLIFSFSMGLFVSIYFSSVESAAFLTVNNFLKLSLVIGGLFIAKLIFIRIIAVIFQAEKVARSYITVLYIVYFNSMMFLIPLLILALFLPFEYLDYLMIIMIVGALFLFTYRMIRTALNLLGSLKFSIFYLILYLCALEIAPILILVKSLNN